MTEQWSGDRRRRAGRRERRLDPPRGGRPATGDDHRRRGPATLRATRPVEGRAAGHAGTRVLVRARRRLGTTEHGIRTRFDDPARSIDLAERTVRLASGESVGYADLVIATGARPRSLDLAGVDLPGVHSLRRIPDCLALRKAFGEGRRLVVIGAGWIGLEVAAAARAGRHGGHRARVRRRAAAGRPG